MIPVILFFLFFSFSKVSIYAPELVIDPSAVMVSSEKAEVIASLGADDWYSFIFFGQREGDRVSGKIYGINTFNNPESDMLDAPIPFWYEYRKNGKAAGKINFRDSWRKLCFSTTGKSLPCQ